MNNPTQPVEAGMSTNQTDSDSQLSSKGLQLSGNQPVTVYVQPYTASDNKTKAKFGLSSTGKFYAGGLAWTAGTEYSLFVNFIFQSQGSTTITNIECDASIPLPYTPVANSINQSCAIPPVGGTYKFYVKFSTGERHDPQIVVTPQ